MSTLGELIERTRHQLSGLDAEKDAVSALSSPLGVTGTTLALETAEGLSVGLAEVDLEMVRVKAVSPQDSTATLWSFGRGYRGTAAASHAAGAEVRFNPSWPASSVAREINGTVGEMYPLLYAVASHETTLPADHGAVDVPADAVGIISVWVEDLIRPGQWIREDRWNYNPDGNIGAGLRVGGLWSGGDAVKVVYAKAPGVFNLTGPLNQDFTTVTGLPERLEDLVSLGVAKRLAPFIDVSKLPYIAASAAEAASQRAPGVGGTQTRLLQALWTTRLQEEAQVLTREHPIRVHRGR